VQASATAEGLLLLEAAGDGAAVLLADALKGALPLAGGPLQARQARGAARGARALKLALTGAASDARDARPLLLRQAESRKLRGCGCRVMDALHLGPVCKMSCCDVPGQAVRRGVQRLLPSLCRRTEVAPVLGALLG